MTLPVLLCNENQGLNPSLPFFLWQLNIWINKHIMAILYWYKMSFMIFFMSKQEILSNYNTTLQVSKTYEQDFLDQ